MFSFYIAYTAVQFFLIPQGGTKELRGCSHWKQPQIRNDAEATGNSYSPVMKLQRLLCFQSSTVMKPVWEPNVKKTHST